MAIIAVIALLLAGYRTAAVRRHFFRMSSINYEIDCQRMRLEILKLDTRARRSEADPTIDPGLDELAALLRAMGVDPGDDPRGAYASLLDRHLSLVASYNEAARSRLAWLRFEPVNRSCGCRFCDFVAGRRYPMWWDRRERR
ncbi:hypothetical protein [Tautonia plasticadhaerens]|nr:hypothetical protein [Tautonia plasticadhaerens]